MASASASAAAAHPGDVACREVDLRLSRDPDAPAPRRLDGRPSTRSAAGRAIAPAGNVSNPTKFTLVRGKCTLARPGIPLLVPGRATENLDWKRRWHERYPRIDV